MKQLCVIIEIHLCLMTKQSYLLKKNDSLQIFSSKCLLVPSFESSPGPVK